LIADGEGGGGPGGGCPVGRAVGDQNPELPLWLRDVEAPVRVDLDAAYAEARQRSAIG
jgi:hypothetical protein